MTSEVAKALCAWFNSTSGVLEFLYRRSGQPENCAYSKSHLGRLGIPDFRRVSSVPLLDAFEQTKDSEFKPLKHAPHDEIRDCLDRAAAKTTGIDVEKIRDWRARISKEPKYLL